MSNDLNRFQGIGRLGKDPDSRYTQSGDAVVSFSIACGQSWKDKNGDKQEKTEWVNVTAFGKLGEICAKYLAKGSQIYIEGRLQTDKWTDKEGKDRYTTKVIAERMQMLGTRNQEGHEPKAEKTESAAPTEPDFDDALPF